MRARLSLCLALCLGCAPTDSESDDLTATDGESETSADAQPCEEQATPADCTAASALGAEQGLSCAWVDVRTIDGTQCETSGVQAECITLMYQGAGCQAPGSCGEFEGANTYVRVGEDPPQIMQLETCEDQPQGWTQCVWAEETEGVEPSDVCECVCG